MLKIVNLPILFLAIFISQGVYSACLGGSCKSSILPSPLFKIPSPRNVFPRSLAARHQAPLTCSAPLPTSPPCSGGSKPHPTTKPAPLSCFLSSTIRPTRPTIPPTIPTAPPTSAPCTASSTIPPPPPQHSFGNYHSKPEPSCKCNDDDDSDDSEEDCGCEEE